MQRTGAESAQGGHLGGRRGRMGRARGGRQAVDPRASGIIRSPRPPVFTRVAPRVSPATADRVCGSASGPVPAPEGRGAYTGKTEIVHAVLDGSAPVIAAGESVSLALEANAEVPPDRRYMSPLVAVAAAPPDAAAHDALVKSLEGVR